MTAAKQLIEETPRGPSIAGTRITVYSVMDYIKGNRSKEYILEMMPSITAEELDAVYDYIEQHRDAVEEEYAQILRRSAGRQEEARQKWLARAPYPPDLPEEERRKRIAQRIA
jgi:uncharacterized protein (DUF433 family)